MGIIKNIAVIGAGTMGRGIAQIAAQNGHPTFLVDAFPTSLESAKIHLLKMLQKLENKGRLQNQTATEVFSRIHFLENINQLENIDLVVEAIIENIDVKKELFNSLSAQLSENTIFATNTSSLSIAAISSACKFPGNFVGMHFFNPAPLLPLVEIIPGLLTTGTVASTVFELMKKWQKVPVFAKDTPGFIVNRVARPFYAEALRIYEEGIANIPTIDWAMKTISGFRMGPFELMDLIGNDINFTVTKTVFESFFYDPRYRPSITQQRFMEAGLYGRKSGRGFYNYADETQLEVIEKNDEIAEMIVNRILAMLINEAIDAVFWNIATAEDVELAMTKGVNYPKGLLQWGNEIGLKVILRRLENLQAEFSEDRYRPSPLLRKMVRDDKQFFEKL